MGHLGRLNSTQSRTHLQLPHPALRQRVTLLSSSLFLHHSWRIRWIQLSLLPSLINNVIILNNIVLDLRSQLVKFSYCHIHIQSSQNITQILITIQPVTLRFNHHPMLTILIQHYITYLRHLSLLLLPHLLQRTIQLLTIILLILRTRTRGRIIDNQPIRRHYSYRQGRRPTIMTNSLPSRYPKGLSLNKSMSPSPLQPRKILITKDLRQLPLTHRNNLQKILIPINLIPLNQITEIYILVLIEYLEQLSLLHHLLLL